MLKHTAWMAAAAGLMTGCASHSVNAGSPGDNASTITHPPVSDVFWKVSFTPQGKFRPGDIVLRFSDHCSGDRYCVSTVDAQNNPLNVRVRGGSGFTQIPLDEIQSIRLSTAITTPAHEWLVTTKSGNQYTGEAHWKSSETGQPPESCVSDGRFQFGVDGKGFLDYTDQEGSNSNLALHAFHFCGSYALTAVDETAYQHYVADQVARVEAERAEVRRENEESSARLQQQIREREQLKAAQFAHAKQKLASFPVGFSFHCDTMPRWASPESAKADTELGCPLDGGVAEIPYGTFFSGEIGGWQATDSQVLTEDGRGAFVRYRMAKVQ